MIEAKEAIYVSVVLTVREPNLTPPTLRVPNDTAGIEQKVNATVRVAEGVSDRGSAIVVDVQKHRLQGILAPGRIEVRSTEDAAESYLLMGTLLWQLIGLWKDARFDKIGYNFGYLVRVSEPAIQYIGQTLFNTNALSVKLGSQVLGTSTSLWMPIKDTVLRLRLEPRNQDRESKWVFIDANFEAKVSQEGPAAEADVAHNLGTRKSDFQDILKRIELW